MATDATIWNGVSSPVVNAINSVGAYSDIRAYVGSLTTLFLYNKDESGFFNADSTDVTTADDGLFTIVAANGMRWKRVLFGPMTINLFGDSNHFGSALERCESLFPIGFGLEIPTGSYFFDKKATLTKGRGNTRGAGRWASRLNYNIADAGPAININNPDPVNGYNQGVLGGFSINSNNATDKTAIALHNVANYEVYNVAMTTGGWPGANSIGINAFGRQLVYIHDCEIVCARPIVFSPNPAYPSLSTDFFVLERNELIGTSAAHPVIEIESGACFSNFRVEHVSIGKGGHGIFYDDSAAAAASFVVKIDDLRCEQGMDPAAYCVYLSSTAQVLQSVRITDSYFDSQRNGVFLKNVQEVIIDGTTFACGAGKNALHVELAPGGRLIFRNCYVQTGATIEVVNGKLSSRQFNTATNTRDEVWVYDNPAAPSPKQGSLETAVYQGGELITVPAGGTVIVADGNYYGWLEVSQVNGAGAFYYLRGAAAVAPSVPVTTDAGYFSNAVSAPGFNFNVYKTGGNFVLQNTLGVSVNFNIKRSGRTV